MDPAAQTDGELKELIEGMSLSQESQDIRRWAEQHIASIKLNQEGKHRYDRQWSQQRIQDISLATDGGNLLQAEDKKRIAFNRIVMEPDSYHTAFLVFDRPPNGQPGQAHEIEISQHDMTRKRVMGGLSASHRTCTRTTEVAFPSVRPTHWHAAVDATSDRSKIRSPSETLHSLLLFSCRFR